jgi:hypothetical protein
MTSKEKAIELMQKSYDLDLHNKTPQWKCKGIALLAVDEIIKVFNTYDSLYISEIEIPYWNRVRSEIEKL